MRIRCMSKIDEVALLLVGGHRVALLGLGVSIEVLRVDEVADLGDPGRVDTATQHHLPVDATEPLVLLHFVRAVL